MNRFSSVNERKVHLMQNCRKNLNRWHNLSGASYKLVYHSINNPKMLKVFSERQIHFDEVEMKKVNELWQFLCVDREYQSKFKDKLTYLSEGIRNEIISLEKSYLISISRIINDINFNLQKLREWISKIVNDNKYQDTFKNISTDHLSTSCDWILRVKEYSMNIFSLYLKYRKIYQQKRKFKFDQLFKGILNDNFVIDTINELSAIKDSKLGRQYNFLNVFDILLFDEGLYINRKTKTVNKIQSKNISKEGEILYFIVNEMITNDYPFKQVKRIRKVNLSAKKVFTGIVDKTEIENKNMITKDIVSNKVGMGSLGYNSVVAEMNKTCRNRRDGLENLKENQTDGIEMNHKHKLKLYLINSEKKNQTKGKILDNVDYKGDIEKKMIEGYQFGKTKQDAGEKKIENEEKEKEKEKEQEQEKKQEKEKEKEKGKEKKKKKEEKENTEEKEKENSEEKVNSTIPLLFYTEDLNSFYSYYSLYYPKIPKFLLKPLNIQKEIPLEGVSQMLIYNSPNKDPSTLTSLLSLSYLNDEPDSIMIDHYSTTLSEISLIKSELSHYLTFIQNKIPFKLLYINLYWELIDKKLNLNKDINNLFIQLGFKWLNLINCTEGLTCQKMKFENKSKNKIETSIIPSLDIQSCLVIYCNNKEENSDNCNQSNNNNSNINSNNNTDELSNINPINKLLCVLENNNKEKVISKVSQIVNRGIKTFQGKSMKEFKKFLSKSKINISLQRKKESKSELILCSTLSITQIFPSSTISKINHKYYYCISNIVELVKEEETSQLLYMLKLNDFVLLIGEVNDKFETVINKGDIYQNFSKLFSTIELDSVAINNSKLFLPVFTFDSYTSSIDLPSSEIKNIVCIESFNKASASFKSEKNFINLNVLPKENDIVINNKFFIGLIKEELNDLLNSPLIFCCIVNPSK